MKKILMALIAGLMIAACGISYAGDKKSDGGFRRGHGKMKTFKQPDEIDQLLMIVLASERNAAKAKCPMMGKGKTKPCPQCKCPEGKCTCSKTGKEGSQCKCPEGKCTCAKTDKDGKKSHMKGRGRKHGRMMAGKGRMQHGRQAFGQAWMLKGYLQKKYPEELKEITAMKKSSDETAKKVVEKFKALVDKAQAELKEQREKAIADHKKMVEMITEYKKSKDAKLGEQIKAKLGEYYDKRLEFMKKKIELDSERIQKEKEKLEELGKNKDQELTKQLEQIAK
jgi:hypothetical protein